MEKQMFVRYAAFQNHHTNLPVEKTDLAFTSIVEHALR